MDDMYWLSFCDPDLPAGKKFLGAAVIPAESFTLALVESKARGCNPGGEVQGVAFSSNLLPIPSDYVGRLLNKDDIAALEKRFAKRGNKPI